MTIFHNRPWQVLTVRRIYATLLLLLAVQIVFRLPVAAASRHGADDEGRVSGRVLLPDGAAANASTVVWLEAPGLHGKPLRRAVMDQREKTFIPHILIVTPGTKVTFPNNDAVFHNVFAYFEAKRFDLGMYPKGQKREQVFDKPGVVSVLCNIHPRMSGFILIVDSPYYAQANKKGEFALKGVASGNYTLHAWHESGAEVTQNCAVSANGGDPVVVRLKPR